MVVLRRLAMLAVVVSGFAVLSSPAFAASSRDNSLPFEVHSTNFIVHYQSDRIISPASAITQTQAGDIAALAERALTAEQADGYPRPLTDGALGGDGRIDIYVEDYSAFPGTLGATFWDTNNATSSAFIELAGNAQPDSFSQHTIAHELFHAIQIAMWLPTRLSDYWLMESTAEWMGFRVDGYPAPGTDIVPMDMALDCRDPIGTDGSTYDSNMCDLTDDYLGNGYSRWPFFEYLSENYGSGFLKDVFAQGLAGYPNKTAIQAVADAVMAKGSTLADQYNNWTAAVVRGGYSVATLQARDVEVYGAPISTGTVKATLRQHKVPVNHLSTRVLQFDRGGGSATGTCYAATLTLSVTIPNGTLSKPVFYWNMPGTPITVLSVNGNKATATVPWDTCVWPTGHGYLVLPNASTAVDAADFFVDASIDVNTALPAAAADPPPGVTVTTPVVTVPTGDPAPTLSVFGPQVLKLSSTVKQIRLIVESNGAGSLQATLGSTVLGSQALRIGSNDVRFALPAGVLKTLRRTASSSFLLTLTPLSASGSPGVAVTRSVSVLPDAKPAPKAHAKKPTKKTAKKAGHK